ncbi:neuronal acetylcholine receptor subunit alpha-3-like isoform X2 [Amphiura filiformis]|uniref:neuronal acetylcholine receptor subunit alpha-3-like isoform X2 n=1 Tax=Amphiura filiformis TaxID=82378 RepID=UPI003B228EF4
MAVLLKKSAFKSMQKPLAGLPTYAILLWILLEQLFNCGEAVPDTECPDKVLWKNLLTTYGPISLRPVRNHTHTTTVSFRMLISQIVEFDERLQQIKISCWLKQQWFDEFLTWNPAFNGNVSQLYVPQTDVWVPDITLYDNIDDHFEHVKDILLWISHTGLVTWYTPAILKSSCKVQVKNFPFDIQYCEMTFASWSYDSSELNIVYTNDSDATQNVFHSNGVWLLEKVHVKRKEYKFACCEHPWAYLVYSFEMKRSPSFYISNIIVPCILLSFMTMLVFTLPPRSGEKIQLGMTNLLALLLFNN